MLLLIDHFILEINLYSIANQNVTGRPLKLPSNRIPLYIIFLMLFKVSCAKEIHILKSTNAKNLQELKNLIPKVFK